MTRPAVPHTVYRCYDADDRLIYIGCTSMTIARRMHVHKRSNPAVYEQAARVTTERYPDKASGLAAEAEAIYAEQPTLNRRGKRYPLASACQGEPSWESLVAAVNSMEATA